MAYEYLAQAYDKLMDEDVDYIKWAEYCTALLQRYHCPGKALLDIGCGTGNITIPMAQSGWEMTGVDISQEMLEQAKTKASAAAVHIPFYCQDIVQWQTDQQWDGAIATFDTINYIVNKKDLQKVLDKLCQSLKPGGVFLFDINSAYKLEMILGDNIYTYHSKNLDYVWENHFSRKICHMDLTFFIRKGKLYEKRQEHHKERAYSVKELQQMLEKAGFRFLAAYDELTLESALPEAQEERIVIVAKK